MLSTCIDAGKVCGATVWNGPVAGLRAHICPCSCRIATTSVRSRGGVGRFVTAVAVSCHSLQISMLADRGAIRTDAATGAGIYCEADATTVEAASTIAIFCRVEGYHLSIASVNGVNLPTAALIDKLRLRVHFELEAVGVAARD